MILFPESEKKQAPSATKTIVYSLHESFLLTTREKLRSLSNPQRRSVLPLGGGRYNTPVAHRNSWRNKFPARRQLAEGAGDLRHPPSEAADHGNRRPH